VIELHLVEGGSPIELELADEVGEALRRSGVVGAARSSGGRWELTPLAKVGVVKIAGVTVWLRPKIPIRRLLFLLGYASRPGWDDDVVALERTQDFLPVLATAFAAQAHRALEQGLLQGYVEVEDTLAVLRGRLDEQVQLRRRFGIAVPLAVRYDEYTPDIAENRLLRGATELLLSIPGVPGATRSQLRHLRLTLADVTPPIRGSRLPVWRPSRLNARYQVALWLAELLLRRNALDQRAGRIGVTGFVVDMWRVFEDFVTVALAQTMVRHGGHCFSQDRHHLDEAHVIAMRPDLVWYRDGSPTAVVDAKYKAERPQGFPDADLYQVLAYCTALGLADGHLVYARGNEPEVRHTVRNAGVVIHAHTLDLTAESGALLGQVDALADRIAATAAACALPLGSTVR
jgi:5-methylcytosine-specific restriction enzyme subunit McrC